MLMLKPSADPSIKAYTNLGLSTKSWCLSQKGVDKAPEGKLVHLGLH